ncbi:MerR family DNA-binding transcriptional regulator [Tissierella carlieri]|uniref:MerR family DNA-binding transcriptional regulator n=1 Tax=Tissierella carlieri TaxID=689904 RepID=A0ABT1S6C6_9FIRM|nr:MerR family DNA-binding transcriptional regulator [Tissierella carlieri]MCQ4922032.1 MerR family DNA-binding transcriptional regulator [Tissierella carlieri]
MKELLRIGQVSKLYGISLDTLRHYDRKGLLKPIVDPQNDYRYYSLEHLDILEMILVGKYMKIPLDQMNERINSESIDGYLSMVKEQKERINEEKRLLNQLDQYVENMLEVLMTISKFKNDYTFSAVSVYKEVDITIYRIDLETLLHQDTESQQVEGIESFEQWAFYHSESDRTIVENDEIIGFSFPDSTINTTILQKQFISAAEHNIVAQHHVTGCYATIMFWGIKRDLMEYLYKLYRHFNLHDSTILVKYKFALLHKSMEHEYFVEIYFPQNPV